MNQPLQPVGLNANRNIGQEKIKWNLISPVQWRHWWNSNSVLEVLNLDAPQKWRFGGVTYLHVNQRSTKFISEQELVYGGEFVTKPSIVDDGRTAALLKISITSFAQTGEDAETHKWEIMDWTFCSINNNRYFDLYDGNPFTSLSRQKRGDLGNYALFTGSRRWAVNLWQNAKIIRVQRISLCQLLDGLFGEKIIWQMFRKPRDVSEKKISCIILYVKGKRPLSQPTKLSWTIICWSNGKSTWKIIKRLGTGFEKNQIGHYKQTRS